MKNENNGKISPHKLPPTVGWTGLVQVQYQSLRRSCPRACVDFARCSVTIQLVARPDARLCSRHFAALFTLPLLLLNCGVSTFFNIFVFFFVHANKWSTKNTSIVLKDIL